MKRARYIEPYLVLPTEIVSHIVSFISPFDTDTYSALLLTEKRAVQYLRERLGPYLIDIYRHLSTKLYDPNPFPADPVYLLWFRQVMAILCCLDRIASRLDMTFPDSIRLQKIQVKQEWLKAIITRQLHFCLVDARYQTPLAWSRLFWFLGLANRYTKCFFTSERKKRDFKCIVGGEDRLDTVLYYDTKDKTIRPLIEWPGLRTIIRGSPSAPLLRRRAIIQAEQKYINLPTKLQVITLALNVGNVRLQNTLLYGLLKTELKLRECRVDDRVDTLVIAPKRGRKSERHHLYAKENGRLIEQCFVYEGTLEEAALARRLEYYIYEDFGRIKNDLLINDKEVIQPITPDAITKRLVKKI